MINSRIFLIKGSYPDLVRVKSKKLNIDETIEFTSLDMFLDSYKHYLALAKSPYYDKVEFYINQGVCGMIWFDHQSWTATAGFINLKGVEDIHFHELKDEEYFSPKLEDLFIKYLDMEDKYSRYLKQALTDISYTDYPNSQRKYDCNFDMANAGDRLMKFALNDYLFELYNESLVELTYQEQFYLTDKQLVEIIAKKYNLIDRVLCSDEVRKNASYVYSEKTIFLAKAIKAFLYAIFLKTRNYNEIMQIVRNFVWETDNTEKNIDKIKEKYKKLGKYLKSKDEYDVEKYISFEEAENAIGDKLDYQFFYYTRLFHDYGYYITKVDFKNKRLYLDICYL